MCVCLGLAFYVFFCFGLDFCSCVVCFYVVLGLVSSVLRQETGWVESQCISLASILKKCNLVPDKVCKLTGRFHKIA